MRPRTLQGRLALLFGVSTVLLAALVGVTVLVQFRTQLRESTDEGLETRFVGLDQALAAQPVETLAGRELVPALPESESFAQVLASDGTVLAAAPRALFTRHVLTRAERADATRGRVRLVRSVPPKVTRARLLAGPARVGAQTVVIVVGTSLDEATKAERRLELSLALGIPLLAGLVSLGGWFLAGAALSPVRAMIEEADDLSVRHPGQRLSIPRGGEEIAELARRLNELLARIEAAVAHERAFLDDASHELRTPIAIVRGEAELARMAAGDAPAEQRAELAAALDSVLEEVERLDRLAGNLLVLARTRAARVREPLPVDLAAVVSRTIGDLARATPDLAVTLSSSGSAIALGDEAELERALANLLDNAVRHASSAVEVRMREEETDDGTLAVVEVLDDGPGFSEEMIAHAFDRFSRGGASRSTKGEGAGLGLAIVEEIAAAHGGEAGVANRPEGGALVWVRIPSARSGAGVPEV